MVNKQGFSLSPDILELLNGKKLIDKQHEAFMLLTVSEDGWPHTAMISVGEIVAVNPQELRLGLWKGTSTTANITRTKKATVVLVFNGKAHYIRISLEKLQELSATSHPRVRFLAKVVSFREDVAKYADISSGVKIELKNSSEVVERWEQTIEDLLK